MAQKKIKNKRRRVLKRSVRRTLAAILMITSLIVVAIPTTDIQAGSQKLKCPDCSAASEESSFEEVVHYTCETCGVTYEQVSPETDEDGNEYITCNCTVDETVTEFDALGNPVENTVPVSLKHMKKGDGFEGMKETKYLRCPSCGSVSIPAENKADYLITEEEEEQAQNCAHPQTGLLGGKLVCTDCGEQITAPDASFVCLYCGQTSALRECTDYGDGLIRCPKCGEKQVVQEQASENPAVGVNGEAGENGGENQENTGEENNGQGEKKSNRFGMRKNSYGVSTVSGGSVSSNDLIMKEGYWVEWTGTSDTGEDEYSIKGLASAVEYSGAFPHESFPPILNIPLHATNKDGNEFYIKSIKDKAFDLTNAQDEGKNKVVNRLVFEDDCDIDFVGKEAFKQQTKLNEVIIRGKIGTINDGAFCDSGVRTFTVEGINGKVTSLGSGNGGVSNVFGGSDLETMNIYGTVDVIHEGVMGSNNNTLRNLVSEPVGTGVYDPVNGQELMTKATIPKIDIGAFKDCRVLSNVKFNQVREIGNNAFQNCQALNPLVFPNNLATIGDNAFNGCISIGELKISSSVETIGEGAFFGAYGLKSVTVENNYNLKSIGATAFRRCTGLENFTFGENSANDELIIGNGAFSDCTSLERIGRQITLKKSDKTNDTSTYYAIPGQTTKLGTSNNRNDASGVFYNCISLKDVAFAPRKAGTTYSLNIMSNTFIGCKLRSLAFLDRGTTMDEGTVARTGVESTQNVLDDFYIIGYKYVNAGTGERTPIYQYVKKSAEFNVDHKGFPIKCLDYGANEDWYPWYEYGVPGGIVSISDQGMINGFEPSEGASSSNPVDVVLPDKVGDTVVKGIATGNERDANTVFKGIDMVRSITIPKTEEPFTIAPRAFQNCEVLEKVAFEDPATVGAIGAQAFLNAGEGNHHADLNLGSVNSGYCMLEGDIIKDSVPFKYAMDPSNFAYQDSNRDPVPLIYKSPFPAETYVQNIEGRNNLIEYRPKTTYGQAGTISGNNVPLLTDDADIADYDFAAKNITIPDGVQTIFRKPYGELHGGGQTAYDNKLVGVLGAHIYAQKINSIGLEDVVDYAFFGCTSLNNVAFSKNLQKDKFGIGPFQGCTSLGNDVTFETGDYVCEDQVIYGLEGGAKTKLLEALPSYDKMYPPNEEVDLSKLTSMSREAFKDCRSVKNVDLSKAVNLETIPDSAFYNCSLGTIILPEETRRIDENAFAMSDVRTAYIPNVGVSIRDTAFYKTGGTALQSYKGGAVESYYRKYRDVAGYDLTFTPIEEIKEYTVLFLDYNGTEISRQTVQEGQDAKEPKIDENRRPGYTFTGWSGPFEQIKSNTTLVALYKQNSSSSSSSSSSGSGSGSGSSSGSTSSSSGRSSSSRSSSSKSSSSKSSSSKSSSSKSSSSSSSSSSAGASSSSAGSTSTYGVTPVAAATSTPVDNNASVDITEPGMSNEDVASANVEGGDENGYVVRITYTEDAKQASQDALSKAYGNLESYEYYPMDISLYDENGQNKIENTEGMNVGITLPLPDALAQYGGNVKPASVVNGNQLENLEPRYSIINDVPCVSFTATHFSPYVLYVDTNNLTANSITDMTPTTGDGIHPKWFLAIGLAALSVVLFLKKDPEERVKPA